MMTIEQWIERHHSGRTQGEVASALGVSRSYLTQILGGTREPGRKTQALIFKATGGAVTPDSWLLRSTAKLQAQTAPQPVEEVIEP